MAGVASGPDWILNGEMVNRTTSIMCIAPRRQARKARRQARKEKYFPISLNLVSFAPLQLALWSISPGRDNPTRSSCYSTGLAPWNNFTAKPKYFLSRRYSTGRVIFSGFRTPKFNGKFQIFLPILELRPLLFL